jgi:hypothetical protein
MSEQKLLLFTFDYELFLGEKSGSVQECLIGPTNKLLNLLDECAFKAYFFIDTIYLLRLREKAMHHGPAKTDLDALTQQLVQMVKNGHEIHPHIHPHWMDAVYNPVINDWSLREKRHYSFASVSMEQQMRLFDQSVGIIRYVLDLAKVTQPVDSYRAGGWTIQPFVHFRPRFLQFGIRHEWSVVPGKYQLSDAHSFDFRGAPADEPVYHFDEDPCRKDAKGPFTEWTISSITMSGIEKWIDFKISGLLHRLGKRPAYKGKGVSSVIREEGDLYSSKGEKRIIASFEGLNPLTQKKYLSAIQRSGYFQFISHPKLITPYEFNMMEKFFGSLKRKFEIGTDFRKTLAD